ncbi:hypothetical protein B0H13DRAFT_1864604 [Mycena leptocephala]|nr:hypothetical protein B0H13DRAFT_1864604 [Mycena leptocephala]
MLPAAAVSVKSAARWGIFVRRPGIRMACVEGGRGGLYIASGDHEGRHGGTRVNQRRGQVQNQRGGAFVRFAPFGGRAFAWHACVTQCEGTEVFASRRGGHEGRAGHGRTSAAAGRARRALAAYRGQTAAGCAAVFGTFTLGVKAAGASALRRGRMGKQRGSGPKAAADCPLVHMARERGRGHETGGAAGKSCEAGAFTFASCRVRRGELRRFLVSAGAWGAGEVGAVCGRTGLGGAKATVGAQEKMRKVFETSRELRGLIRKKWFGLEIRDSTAYWRPRVCLRLLDGKGFGTMAYIEDGDPPIACKIRCREKEWRGWTFIRDPIGYPLRKVAAPLYVADLERGGGGRQEASPWRAVAAVVTPRKRRSRSRFDDIQIHTTLPSFPPPSPPSPLLRPSGDCVALSTFGVGSQISLFGVEVCGSTSKKSMC